MKRYVHRDEIDTSLFFGDVDIHPLTLLLLAHRGVQDRESADVFLNPSYERDIGDPLLIHGMKQAVARIIQAIQSGENIALYTDYDCDGIPGGVVLRDFFTTIGYPVEVYIPHRHKEGYGLHEHAIDALCEKGVKLIITVDLAITDIDEVAYAKKKGIDCIVTDHHLPIHNPTLHAGNTASYAGHGKVVGTQVVPDAVAVVNSKQDVCLYEDDMLCGCAVAWKLVCALISTLKEETGDASESLRKVVGAVKALPVGYEKWLLDLVGISTISDMVPLQKENRALAYFGLKVLQKTKRVGLRHIFLKQKIAQDKLTEEDIAFTIAPRINAASRMGIPMQAHSMLFEKESNQARMYAEDLEVLNTERKQGVKDIIGGISFDHDAYKREVVVVGDMSWGPGILGLIAQKIIDETGKPAFVWGSNQEEGKSEEGVRIAGSCRGAGGVHVVELMALVGKIEDGGIFSHFGGHEQAGGFSLPVDNIPRLADALNEAITRVVRIDTGADETYIDAELSLEDVHNVTHDAVQALAPFGIGNPKPIFSFSLVTPISVRRFGKQMEHIEAVYKKGGATDATVKAIQFFASEETEERLKKSHTLVAHLEKSYWGGKSELRLRIVDVL